jgi:uncharacterized protein YjiS (DUF1127 family)
MSTQQIQINAADLASVTGTSLWRKTGAALATAERAIRDVVTACIRYRAFKVAERKLMELDDRMLRDIGLDRTEIRSALMNVSAERLNGAQLMQALSN